MTNDQNAREYFDAVVKSLVMDKEIGTFGQEASREVSWLATEPTTVEEIANNLYERLRATGISLHVNLEDIDAGSLMGAYLARKQAVGADFPLQ